LVSFALNGARARARAKRESLKLERGLPAALRCRYAAIVRSVLLFFGAGRQGGAMTLVACNSDLG